MGQASQVVFLHSSLNLEMASVCTMQRQVVHRSTITLFPGPMMVPLSRQASTGSQWQLGQHSEVSQFSWKPVGQVGTASCGQEMFLCCTNTASSTRTHSLTRQGFSGTAHRDPTLFQEEWESPRSEPATTLQAEGRHLPQHSPSWRT